MILLRQNKIAILALFLLISVFFTAFAQEVDSKNVSIANSIIKDARNAENAQTSISILTDALKKSLDSNERLSVLAFLASLQEQLGLYEEACTNYSLASNLSASINYSAKKGAVANEEYLLGVVRCALSYGDTNIADFILSTGFSGNESQRTKAFVKLYAVWSWLCKIDSSKELEQPIVVLKSYLQLSSLISIKPAILLTLLHITGDEVYVTTLKNEFPFSPETVVATGNGDIIPAPFWFFVSKANTTITTSEKSNTETTSGNSVNKTAESISKPVNENISNLNKNISNSTTETTPVSSLNKDSEKLVRHQLGFFRSESNANDLVQRLKKSGFIAEIRTEVRPSGTVYYAVTVLENENKNMSELLKNSGYESYPVYE